MKLNWLFPILCGLLVMTSCQNKGPSTPNEPLDQGYMLIDQGHFDDAIQYFSQLETTDSRPQVKVALASAYAGRAGIQVENYWGFVIGFNNPLIHPQDVDSNATVVSLQALAGQTQSTTNTQQTQALTKMGQLAAVWDQYDARIQQIPTVQGSALQDLQQALEILQDVQTPGGRLYRAILGLIVFKSYLAQSQDVWNGLNQVIQKVIGGDLQAFCQLNFDLLDSWLEPLGQTLTGVLGDLQIAFPDHASELSTAHDFVQKLQDLGSQAIDQIHQQGICN